MAEPQAPPDKVPWAKVKQAFADPGDRVDAIAGRFGLSRKELLEEAKRRNWPPRSSLPRRKTACAKSEETQESSAPAAEVAEADAGSAGKKTGAVQPQALVKRIYSTIDKELSKLESHTGASSQDRERASRALSQMVSSLEKAVEMQREIAKETGRGQSRKDKEALKHAEEMRREIADRLERLHSKRAAAK